MVSLGSMVGSIAGLAGTKDVTEWESTFIESVVDRTNNGSNTGSLSDKQITVIERIYKKHFGVEDTVQRRGGRGVYFDE